MNKYTETKMWLKTLGNKDLEDQNSIDTLRNTFISFREKASTIANEISNSLPNYTVHDITHIDALWDMADCICGDNYNLNPVEGFVLGGAFLLHDLAMSIYAYPDGIEELEKLDLWNDTVSQQFRLHKIPFTTSTKYDELPQRIKDNVLSTVLRKLHASSAEKLATIKWENPSTKEPFYLIDNTEIRQSLGKIIGKLAHSHWWDISKLENEFSRTLGSPVFCPRDWTIDPLKIACILRVADASHIDARRAPPFLRSLKKLNTSSDEHWLFQERLQKPYLSEDSLFYTSGHPFTPTEAPAWWLCFEALKMIDKELRQTDALLADKGMPRFKAKRVFGIESPERLASLITCDNWSPIDAFIHIGDLPKIIRTLGGEELYGQDLKVPIREMIQNAKDAINARKLLENRKDNWGDIVITIGDADGLSYIEIEDNGIGMSIEVIKNYLFDFGTSYWGSELMIEEYPGLMAKNLQQTGKYGIGFFSSFMLGENITITTRKCSSSQQDTNIVEFRNGLNARPIIRKANSNEYLIDGGTKIKIEFQNNKLEKVLTSYKGKKISITDLCISIAPALDVSITINERDSSYTIPSNYWKTCTNEEFIELLVRINKKNINNSSNENIKTYMESIAKNIQTINDIDGNVIGRAFLTNGEHEDVHRLNLSGIITVGGLEEMHMSWINGILLGVNNNASRTSATPLSEGKLMAEWATNQADIVDKVFDDKECFQISQIIRILKGEPKSLPIAKKGDKFYSYKELEDIIENETRFTIVGDFFYKYHEEEFPRIKHIDNIYHAHINHVPGIFHNRYPGISYSADKDMFYKKTHLGYICDIISEKWNVPIKVIEEFISKQEYGKDIVIATNESVELKQSGYVFDKLSLLASNTN